MPWTDSHCHLHDPKVADPNTPRALDDVLRGAAAAQVRRLITVGCDEATSRAAIACAAAAGDAPDAGVEVWATVGCHPHDARLGWDWMPALLADSAVLRVVAVGECGLDYHYDHSPRDEQRAAFVAQVGLANQFGLPLVIHTRDAWDDTLAILAGEGVPTRTVFHCFSGGAAEAERCLALASGVFLSFSGILSFPSAADVREAARNCPVNRTLVETDAPYLSPVPFRGRPNRPAYVAHVGAALATATDRPLASVEADTWLAATDAFALPRNDVQTTGST